MSKYDPLGFFLRAQPMSNVPMTFKEIESVIGFALPPVAKTARAWWSNNASNNVMTKVWTAAGFRSEQVDMASETLVFRRETPPPPASGDSMGGVRRHPAFGCLRGAITVSSDLDLSAPADPAWGQTSA